MVETIEVKRLTMATVFKLSIIGYTTLLIPLGLILGLAAMFGAQVVQINGQYVVGGAGLVAGVALGVLFALFLSVLTGLCISFGMFIFSMYRPTISIHFQR